MHKSGPKTGRLWNAYNTMTDSRLQCGLAKKTLPCKPRKLFCSSNLVRRRPSRRLPDSLGSDRLSNSSRIGMPSNNEVDRVPPSCLQASVFPSKLVWAEFG